MDNEEEIPGYHGEEVESGDGDIYKWPKPQRRPGKGPRERKNASKTHERTVSKRYQRSGFTSAQRTAKDGSSTAPYDVDTEWFAVECKRTRGGRLVITKEWIDKVSEQSKKRSKPWWALHAWVADDTSNYRRVVVLDEDHFFEIIKDLKGWWDD